VSSLSQSANRLSPGFAKATLGGLWPIALGITLAACLQVFIKPHIDAYYALIALNIGVNIVLAVSLNIVNGFTGQFSIGHAGFLAVGGYAAGAVTYYGSICLFGSADVHGGLLSGMPMDTEGLAFLGSGDALFLVALIVGGLVAALAGLLVGLPSLRLRGDYLAIVTLGFGEIVRVLLQQTDTLIKRSVGSETAEQFAQRVRDTPWWQLPKSVGGALGFTDLPKYTSLFWVYALVAVMLIVAFRLKESSYGRAFLSIREDEIAAESMGVNTTRYKVWAFVIAAFFAGMAGGLFAHQLGTSLSPVNAGFQKSFDIIIMVVLGGLGSISGATLAAIILTIIPEWLRGVELQTSTIFLLIGLTLLAVGVLKVYRARAIAKKTGIEDRSARRRAIGPALGLILISQYFFRGHLPAALQTTINLGEYRMILYALILIIMMIARPKGLFGVRELWNIGPWAKKARVASQNAGGIVPTQGGAA